MAILTLARVERVPQPVAEQVERQHHSAIHGACERKRVAVLSMLPQLGAGGCWPSPRKERLASAMIAAATARVAWTKIGAKTLGRMWRIRMRRCGLPTARAA